MSTLDPAVWFRRHVLQTGFFERYPLYAAVLSRMEPIVTQAVPVMAVAAARGRFLLLHNEEWFASRSHFLPGVLLHEVHHVVLGHVTDPRYRNAPRPELMELAMEMSANEHITEPLPAPIVWQDYRQHGMRAGQSTLERHRILRQQAPASTAFMAARRPWIDDHTPWCDGDTSPIAAAALRQLLRDVATDPIARAAAGRRRSDRLAGRELPTLLEELGQTVELERPIDWRAELQRFFCRDRARTWHRPNRRWPERVGELPGTSRGGRGRPRILVAIDTSGSIQRVELAQIAAEVDRLARRARVTVVECDDRIRRLYPYRGRLDSLRGRGGTDLRPPFDPDLLRRHGPDGIAYFTDGCGPWPMQPPRQRVLWVLTEGAPPFGCGWGRRARMGHGIGATPGAAATADPDFDPRDVPF